MGPVKSRFNYFIVVISNVKGVWAVRLRIAVITICAVVMMVGIAYSLFDLMTTCKPGSQVSLKPSRSFLLYE